MEWLSQSWMWILAAVGVFWLLTRVGHGRAGGCCGERAHEEPGAPQEAAAAEKKTG